MVLLSGAKPCCQSTPDACMVCAKSRARAQVTQLVASQRRWETWLRTPAPVKCPDFRAVPGRSDRWCHRRRPVVPVQSLARAGSSSVSEVRSLSFGAWYRQKRSSADSAAVVGRAMGEAGGAGRCPAHTGAPGRVGRQIETVAPAARGTTRLHLHKRGSRPGRISASHRDPTSATRHGRRRRHPARGSGRYPHRLQPRGRRPTSW